MLVVLRVFCKIEVRLLSKIIKIWAALLQYRIHGRRKAGTVAQDRVTKSRTQMEKSICANRAAWLLRVGMGATLLAGGSLANAVEPRLYQLSDGGAIAPHLTVEIGSDSNPLRQDAGSDGSAFIRLEPSLRYLVRQRNNSLSLQYKGEYLQYGEEFCLEARDADCPNGSPQFDKASYQDHSIGLDGFLEVSRQLRVNVDLERAIEHQPLGTGLSTNLGRLRSLNEPESYANTLVRAQVAYGAPRARGELRFSLTHRDRRFDGDDNLSEKSFQPSGTVLYRVGTKTQVFAGLRQSNVTGGNSARDISEQFAGVTVDASAITSGTFQLRNVTENFDGTRADLEFIGWDLELTWKPRRFSTFTASGGRETSRGLFNLDNANLATFRGDDIGITTTLGVDWKHFWKDRISTDVGFQLTDNEALDDSSLGILGTEADDTTVTVRFEGNYNIRRWLDVGAFVVRDIRDGQLGDRDFERTLVGLTANGTF